MLASLRLVAESLDALGLGDRAATARWAAAVCEHGIASRDAAKLAEAKALIERLAAGALEDLSESLARECTDDAADAGDREAIPAAPRGAYRRALEAAAAARSAASRGDNEALAEAYRGLGDAIATLRAASEPGEAGAKAGGDGADVR